VTDKQAKPPTDWEAIEKEYRAGQLSEAQIARQYNISRAAIQKRAKKNGWNRDLSEKVRTEVAARLVAEGLQAARGATAVDQAAERGVALVLSHRHDIQQNRFAVTKLIAELHSTMDNIDEIEKAIDEETADDENGKRRARMMAAVALPSRAAIANSLASALKTLIPLERQAFNLDERGNAPDGSADNPVNVTLDASATERLQRLLE
jgi:hypothetical protein